MHFLINDSYEVLFYFSFSNLLLAWILLEKEKNGKTKRSYLELSHLRSAFFFSFLVNLAFFGTGNIASVSSFSISSVYRFITIFNPFLMGGMLIFKILIPFFLLSGALGLLGTLLGLDPWSLFLLVLSTIDIMTLNFFFLVVDTGSWLEIGTTISHFMISSAFIIFQIVLFSASQLLLGQVWTGSKRKVN
jgi:phosphatidylinositol glycan class N